MSEKKEAAIDRRDFFRKAGLGAGAVGVAAAAFSAGKSEAAESTGSGAKGSGYRETDHVKKFYELARF